MTAQGLTEDEPGRAVEPETTLAVLAAFADAYRQEIAAEEDVYRTLPFFGTSLGIVIGAIGYVAGRLTGWMETPSHLLFLTSAALLGAAALESIGVIGRLAQAMARRDYQRVGPEAVRQHRLRALRAYYDDLDPAPANRDAMLVNDFRELLIDSYGTVTPINRALNGEWYRRRAQAASHLVRSLLWALCATIIIFVSDKSGMLPKVSP